MPSSFALESPDTLRRSVLFAVELVEPVSQTLVYKDIEVSATGLVGAPIVTRSGRFVWLDEAGNWPEQVHVRPNARIFAPHVASAPPRPADMTAAKASERLLRIELRPSAVYPFDFGVTAVRGRVVEGLERDSPPVVGALVQLAWFDLDSARWLPTAPTTMGSVLASPAQVQTDDNGEFAVFLRLNPDKPAAPDVAGGLLNARLQVTRGGIGISTRVTPADFAFSTGSATGRLPEGQLLVRDLTLAWTELTLI